MYPTRMRIHSRYPRLLCEYCNRTCVVKRARFASCSACHGKELGSILLCHRIKNIRTWRPHNSGLIAYSRICTLESGFKNLRTLMPDSPDKGGRKPYPERNSCGLKKKQIRVASEYLLKASPRYVALGITCHFLVQLLRIMKSYSIDAVLLTFYLLLMSITPSLPVVCSISEFERDLFVTYY